MTEEVKQEAQEQTSETKEVTLDDVYRDSGLDKVVAQETTQPQVQTQTQQPQVKKLDPSSIPDAYDSDNFKNWLAQNAAGTQELHSAVERIAQHLGAEQRSRLLASTKADIDSAVSAIEETVQIGKPKVVEAYLDGEVRADPRLKALWENRSRNPAAWNSAVGVVAKKMAKEFDFKVDPALAAAQRARKESQKTMATTSPEEDTSSMEAQLGKATGADFDRLWQQGMGGN